MTLVTPVLLVHGGGAGAFAADLKLAESLKRHLGAGYAIHYPAMPDEDAPDYAIWRTLILRDLETLDGAMLVGHSIGASVLAKMATETVLRARALFLVAAPFWYDHDFWRWDDARLRADAAARFPRNLPLFLYHGADDSSIPVEHVEMYARALPMAIVRVLARRDHQLNDDMSEVAEDIRSLAEGRVGQA